MASTCPVCTDPRFTVYLTSDTKTILPSMVGSSRMATTPGRILRCQNCHFGFSEYRPTDDQLARWYQQMETDVYEAESAGRAHTAETQITLIQRYVGRPGRLLDVGCASGLFLRCAAEVGWDVAGVELSEQLCRAAKDTLGSNAVIHRCALQHASFSASSFDVITLWDVLEHVRDPVGFMKRCASLLKPNGRLFANVPNLDSIQSRILGSHWPLLLPEHLNYFNPASLRKCGQEAGLEWEAFCRRSAVFSADYIMYRLSQHRIPGSKLARHVVRLMGLGARFISLRMGEICGVWRRRCGDSMES